MADGKSVTISGRPVEIVPVEQSRVEDWLAETGIVTPASFYATYSLDGFIIQKPRPFWARRWFDRNPYRRGFYKALDRAVAILKRLSRRAAFGPPSPPRYVCMGPGPGKRIH